MGRLIGIVAGLAVLVPAGTAFTMVTTVPSSAFVVPTIEITSAGEPIRITPNDLGARRTADGLQVDGDLLEHTVNVLAERFHVPAQPGSYELTPDGVILTHGASGLDLDREGTKALLVDALRGRAPDLTLPVVEVPAPPPPQVAVVVNLSEFRLQLYEGTSLQKEYTVGVGKLDFPTPPGVYHVASKAVNPTWRNPGSRWSRGMPAYIPPGPRNPLGTRALRLDRDAIVIHGTPNPSSVGQRSSHGCVRMRRADVEELFELVPVGSPVFIVP